MKYCNLCSRWLCEDNFYRKYKDKSILRSNCKDCVKVGNKKYRKQYSKTAVGKLKQKIWQTIYNKTQRGREILRRNNKKWRETEKGREWYKKYQKGEAWKKLSQKAHKKYWQSEKGQIALERHRLKRINILSLAINNLTGQQWKKIKESQNNRCNVCHKECKLTIDHIIPISKGGRTYRVKYTRFM